MTEEQLKRIKALTVDVAEAVILDSDPTNWTCHGMAPKDMPKDDRYAAKWCRGVAMNSLSVLMRLMAVAAAAQRMSGPPVVGDTPADDGLGYGHSAINADSAEAAAQELLARVQKRMYGKAGG